MFSAIRKGINHAWQIRQPHYFLAERGIDLLMLLGAAVYVLLWFVFTTDALERPSILGLPEGLMGGLVGRAFLEMVALVATFGVLLLLYRYVPNTRVTWGDVWVGALIGTIVFQVLRFGFAGFVYRFSNFTLVYGSLGALMMVLVWVYLSSFALLWGAQVAATYSLLFGTRTGTPSELERPAIAAERGVGLRGVATMVASWLLPSKRSKR